MFLVSHTTMAGNIVSQSRYDVSTTNVMALFWNASHEANISMPDATQERITQAAQNALPSKSLVTSKRIKKNYY